MMYIRHAMWCSNVVNVFKMKEPFCLSRAREITVSQKSSCDTSASCSPGLATQLMLPSAVILCVCVCVCVCRRDVARPLIYQLAYY